MQFKFYTKLYFTIQGHNDMHITKYSFINYIIFLQDLLKHSK